MKLGKLTKIENLRGIWKREAEDFTKWLAQEENIQILSDEIGINLKVLQTEATVGSFYLDILAEEEETGRKVIIENQLEKTNHDHLGKIVTYSAGYEAEIIIWIVKDFREEHKQALDWLNEHTDDKINFFGINLELWQIGQSEVAPKFNIVSQPNQWTKAIRTSKTRDGLSENSIKQLNFIEGFISYCKEKGTTLSLGRPQPSTPAYYTIGIQTKEGWIAVKLNSWDKALKVEYYFKGKEAYTNLKNGFQEKINELFDEKVSWNDMEKYKGASIGVTLSFDLDKSEDWKIYFEWIRKNAEIMQKHFPKLVGRSDMAILET